MTPLIALMGPTGSGKTAAAVALAQKFPIEIISVDSTMVYRGFDIGSAKPSRDIQATAPHHLIDIRNPDEYYSAGEFRKDALATIRAIRASGRIPLLVGGTMLYFKALQFGLSELPARDAQIRADLMTEGEKLGWPALHEHLVAIDAEQAKRISPNDSSRLVRALEIFALTGKSARALQQEQPPSPAPERWITLALIPSDRAQFRTGLANRFHQMLKDGLVEETESILQAAADPNQIPGLRSIGYRQVVEYLQEIIDRDTMIEKGITATCQLAKRQMTWLRSWPGLQKTSSGKEAVKAIELILKSSF